MSTAVSTQPVGSPVSQTLAAREVRVYSQSMLFYWWPVWAVGYLLALLTWLQGNPTEFGDSNVMVHPSRNLGVVFTFTFLLVIFMTHFSVRGVASVAVILGAIALVLLFAYMGWWDDALRALGSLAIFMNLGFYLFFSTSLFLLWALESFILVRFDYYVFRPGQMIHHNVFGGGEETFDTHGMSVIKMRDDLFRHWILGLGSGDIHIATTGARKAEFVVHNVLFVGTKLEHIQRLVAMKPDENSPAAAFTAGQPS